VGEKFGEFHWEIEVIAEDEKGEFVWPYLYHGYERFLWYSVC